jgi:hypothetical protein
VLLIGGRFRVVCGAQIEGREWSRVCIERWEEGAAIVQRGWGQEQLLCPRGPVGGDGGDVFLEARNPGENFLHAAIGATVLLTPILLLRLVSGIGVGRGGN